MDNEARRQARFDAGLVGFNLVGSCSYGTEFYVRAQERDAVLRMLCDRGFHVALYGRWEYMPDGYALVGGYPVGEHAATGHYPRVERRVGASFDRTPGTLMQP